MHHLLDTNICIYFLNRASERLIEHFHRLSPSEIKLSSITVAELFYGADKSKARIKNRKIAEEFVSTFQIIPFDARCCNYYSKIRNALEKSGTPIGPMDMLIASICLANNLIFVTNNTKEFKRITELKVENWL
jgi:tRNA(fMet)-specific endonuclease VapC